MVVIEEELVLYDGYEGRRPLFRRDESNGKSQMEKDRGEDRSGRAMGGCHLGPTSQGLDLLACSEGFHQTSNKPIKASDSLPDLVHWS